MKKFLAILLSVAMIACFAVVANAAETATVTVGTVEVDTAAAKTAKVPITVSGLNYGVANAELTVKVGSEAVTMKAATDGDLGSGAFNEKTGAFAMASTGKLDDEGNVISNGVLLNVILNVEGLDLSTPVPVTVEIAKFGVYTDDQITATEDIAAAVTVVDGAVKAPTAPVESSTPSTVESSTPSAVESSEAESKAPVSSGAVVSTPSNTTPTNPTNPKAGDASAVAVAGVLCAAMAAAFVLTKKNNKD